MDAQDFLWGVAADAVGVPRAHIVQVTLHNGDESRMVVTYMPLEGTAPRTVMLRKSGDGWVVF